MRTKYKRTFVQVLIILPGIRWNTYQQLLQERGDSHAVLLTYDQGALELLAPSPPHEEAKRILGLLVEAIGLGHNADLHPAGSTTLTREDLARGFAPAACFSLAHAAAVRGKATLDLSIDPLPIW